MFLGCVQHAQECAILEREVKAIKTEKEQDEGTQSAAHWAFWMCVVTMHLLMHGLSTYHTVCL